MPPKCKTCGEHYWDGHPCACKPMTNNLNNIPASVRDLLRQIKADSHTECHEVWFGQLATEALPLIERLCQPNTVIVDLDDEKLVERMAHFIRVAARDEVDRGEYDIALIPEIFAKAALAALKEK